LHRSRFAAPAPVHLLIEQQHMQGAWKPPNRSAIARLNELQERIGMLI
jgi:hypothetical protein